MIPNLSPFQPEQYLLASDNLEFIIRVAVSAVLGMVVGIERSVRSKEAGIRTHCIVALTAAVFMILSKYAFMDTEGVLGVKTADASRIASGVVSGISFLGAGIIFKTGHSTIKGLTTAAGMWATAAIGMAVGAGMYWLGLCATVLVLMTQIVFHRFPGYTSQNEQRVFIRTANRQDILNDFQSLLDRHHCVVDSSSISRDSGQIEMHLTIRTAPVIEHQEVLDFLERHSEVLALEVES